MLEAERSVRTVMRWMAEIGYDRRMCIVTRYFDRSDGCEAMQFDKMPFFYGPDLDFRNPWALSPWNNGHPTILRGYVYEDGFHGHEVLEPGDEIAVLRRSGKNIVAVVTLTGKPGKGYDWGCRRPCHTRPQLMEDIGEANSVHYEYLYDSAGNFQPGEQECEQF